MDNPYEPPQSESAASRGAIKQVANSVLGAFVCLLVATFWFQMSSCACGHADFFSAIGVVPACVVAGIQTLRCGKMPPVLRVVNGVILSVLALYLAKIAADILWLGHEPLLR